MAVRNRAVSPVILFGIGQVSLKTSAMVGRLLMKSLGDSPVKRNVVVEISGDGLFSQISVPPGRFDPSEVDYYEIVGPRHRGLRSLYLVNKDKSRIRFYSTYSYYDVRFLLDELDLKIGVRERKEVHEEPGDKLEPKDIAAIVSDRFAKEEAAGFKLFSTIPDTLVKKKLGIFLSLEFGEAELVKSGLSKRAIIWFGGSKKVQVSEEEEAAIQRFDNAVARVTHPRLTSLKILKMLAKRWHPQNLPGNVDPEQIKEWSKEMQWASELIPAKPALLRELIQRGFKERFGFKSWNTGGGDWTYYPEEKQLPFHVDIDFGGTVGDQLRYSVNVHDLERGIALCNLNYEAVLGMGIGHWDFITEEDAPPAVTLLGALVEETVKMGQEILAKMR